MRSTKKEWSGRWDSNPRLDLGKVPYYPYTTAAQNQRNFNTPANPEQDPRKRESEILAIFAFHGQNRMRHT